MRFRRWVIAGALFLAPAAWAQTSYMPAAPTPPIEMPSLPSTGSGTTLQPPPAPSSMPPTLPSPTETWRAPSPQDSPIVPPTLTPPPSPGSESR